MLLVGAAVVLVRQCGREPVADDPDAPGVPIVTAPDAVVLGLPRE